MATVTKWTPYGVALDITATGSTVKRTSATQFTVLINASWETYYSGGKTNYGMSASSGGKTYTISSFGTSRSSGSGSFTGTYSISGNGAATKTITVTFKNYEEDWQGNVTKSATKSVSFSVSVPAWTSYTVKYNANGGTGAPANQTKWKDQTLTLSSTKPTRTGYIFQGWALSKALADAGTVYYTAGSKCGKNENLTLYAVWKAITYVVKFNANGGTGAPASQTKTYGVTLKLSTTKPTRTNYNFLGWSTSASATKATYSAGGSYTTNSAVTLYAVWGLAYVKPRITNLTVARYNELQNEDENGTYAMVTFTYACDTVVSKIDITWESDSGGSGSYTADSLDSLATSGGFSAFIGDGKLSVDSTYNIIVTVRDTVDYTDKPITLNGTAYVMDFKKGGKGVAFGKPSELDNVLDIAFQTRLTGGLLYPVIDPGADLNDLRTPNIYVGENTSTNAYLNCPLTSGTFTLEVMSSGPNGQITQRLTRCYKANPTVYERVYYSSSWGEWSGAWIYPELNNTRFAMYGSDTSANQTRYRKYGNIVELRGIVTPVIDLAGNTTIVPILLKVLPDGYRPSSPIYVVCQGSSNCTWLLSVKSDGEVGFSRYRNGDTSTTAATGTWLPFQATYIV